MKAFRHYLLGRRFKLVSDHEPLNYMHTRQDPRSTLTRWMLRFIDYEYDFEYKKGKLNVNADALSRYPSEKEINDKLPTLRICVLPRPTEKINPKIHKTRATTIDSDKPQQKKRGRPPGVKNRPVSASTPLEPQLLTTGVQTRSRTRTLRYSSEADKTATKFPNVTAKVNTNLTRKSAIARPITKPLTPQPFTSKNPNADSPHLQRTCGPTTTRDLNSQTSSASSSESESEHIERPISHYPTCVQPP